MSVVLHARPSSRLTDLAQTANEEHAATYRAGCETLMHGIACGEALLEARARRALRKKGAAAAELYAAAERMQDLLAQAHGETTDPDALGSYARAGEHYRKVRDEIVRAVLR